MKVEGKLFRSEMQWFSGVKDSVVPKVAQAVVDLC